MHCMWLLFHWIFPHLHALAPSLISSGQEPGTPFAIKVLASLPGRAFKFHFSGSRETNRLDRPEWFLKYLNETLRDKATFFETEIQPVAGNIDAFVGISLDFLTAILIRTKPGILYRWALSLCSTKTPIGSPKVVGIQWAISTYHSRNNQIWQRS